MSKTKGNVVDPIEIVKQYGTDAVRFTLASMASPGTDIAFNIARTEGYRAFANKIWNAARFIFMNIERAREAGIPIDLTKLPEPLTHVNRDSSPEEQWIVSRLSAVICKVDTDLKEYRFDLAASAIYQFFWGDFCDWYLEITKLQLDFSETGNKTSTLVAIKTLLAVFENSLRLLSPFMPFLTEEIWHALYEGTPPEKSIALSRYPSHQGEFLYQEAVWKTVVLQGFVTEVRALRKAVGVPEKEWVRVQFYPNPETGSGTWGELVHRPLLFKSLTHSSDIEFANSPLTGANARSTPNFDIAIIYESTIDVAAERERLTKDIAKYEKGLAAAERQLGNEGFLAKAPAQVVEGLKKQESGTRLLLEKAKAALDALPKD
jgi:valyl-tRNA synthetase